MNADTYILGQLARYSIEQGARYGGMANMLAVAHVMRNRVHQGWQGGSWAHILEAAPEAEGVDWSSEPFAVNLQSYGLRMFLGRIDQVYEGDQPDIYGSGRAVYFCDLHVEAARIHPWFLENIIRRPEEHPRVGTVGPVTLFG